MTPDDFFKLQRSILESNEEHNKLLRLIGNRISFLAWAIIIALAILLSMSFRH